MKNKQPATKNESPELAMDLQAARVRLAASRKENASLAFACGRELGADWVATVADWDELAELLDGEIELPDFGDSWAELCRSLPSLAEYMSDSEKDNAEVGRFLRRHPDPLLDGFMAGAREVSDALDQEEV